MRVTVKLFATLVRFKDGTRAGKPFEVELRENSVVQDLIDHLKIPPHETHIVFINNIIEETHTPLKDGDVVGMFPPVGGGQMRPPLICVRLYGELSRYGNLPQHAGKYSTTNLKLAAGNTLKDLLDFLLMQTSERGYTFINETLSARPNHQPDLDHAFDDGDQFIFYPLNMVPTALDFDMKITNRMTRTVRADENLNLYYHYE